MRRQARTLNDFPSLAYKERILDFACRLKLMKHTNLKKNCTKLHYSELRDGSIHIWQHNKASQSRTSYRLQVYKP